MEKKEHKILTSDGKTRISLNIDPMLLNQIEKSREQKGLSRSGWLTVAIMKFLKDEKN